MTIKKNIKLARYTTFGIGGAAKFFVEARSIEDLKKAVKFSRNKKLKLFILGGGSNILLPDEGIAGLVIKISLEGIKFSNKGSLVSVGAGEVWDSIVAKTVKKGWGGIENLSLIPGTMGGAVYQNIGAYGSELKDILENVEVLDIKTGEIKKLSNKDCRFGYHDSIFQHKEGEDYIVLSANLKLSKNPIPKIEYPDLIKYFENRKPTINEVRKALIKIRKSKLVYPTLHIGTAGSFFKNPVVRLKHFNKITNEHSDIKGREAGLGFVKLFAGQLIEKAGWKGKRLGNIGVSEKHALVLVNYGKGTSGEIKILAKKIKKDVNSRFGVKLEPEVRFI